MKRKIHIGKVGRLIKGVDAGSYVKVVDDFENTGGYLILVSADRTFVQGSDVWAENLEQLSACFDDQNWEVEWLEA